jgi:hypothetical protein
MQIENHLRSLEDQLLNPAVRRNSPLVASLLADDFVEFGSSGRVFDKSSIIEALRNEQTRPASLLSEFSLREISPTTILATYKASRPGPSGEITAQSWRSSLWIHLDGRWQLTFHQGTPIPSQLS